MCEEARDAIFEQLLKLNHDRHREEVEGKAISDGLAAGNGRRSRAQRRLAKDGPVPSRMAFEDDGQARLEF